MYIQICFKTTKCSIKILTLSDLIVATFKIIAIFNALKHNGNFSNHD